MRGWRLGFAGLAAAVTVLVLACSEDAAPSAPRYPDRGTSSSGSSGGGGGSTSGGTSTSGGGPPAGAGYCASLDALYTGVDACCTAEDKTVAPYPLFQIARALAKALCAQYDAAIARGRMEIDAKLEAECVAPVRVVVDKLGCPLPAEYSHFAGAQRSVQSDACVKMLVGKVAQGGACRGDFECVHGLTCVGYTADVDGKCVTPPALGQPCGPAERDGGSGVVTLQQDPTHPGCAPGAYCFVRECVAQKAAGEQCSTHSQCAAGLKCHLNKCGGASAPAAESGACVGNDDCVSPLYCEGSNAFDGGTGTCRKRKAVGATCGTGYLDCEGRCAKADGGGLTGSCVTWCGK